MFLLLEHPGLLGYTSGGFELACYREKRDTRLRQTSSLKAESRKPIVNRSDPRGSESKLFSIRNRSRSKAMLYNVRMQPTSTVHTVCFTLFVSTRPKNLEIVFKQVTIEFEDRMETNIVAKRACYILMSYNISYPLACFNVILAWQRDNDNNNLHVIFFLITEALDKQLRIKISDKNCE